MIEVRKNTSISRGLSAIVDGKEVNIATLTGQVVPGKAMSLSMSVSNPDLAAANHADIAAALDAFVVELRTLAAENGMPV